MRIQIINISKISVINLIRYFLFLSPHVSHLKEVFHMLVPLLYLLIDIFKLSTEFDVYTELIKINEV